MHSKGCTRTCPSCTAGGLATLEVRTVEAPICSANGVKAYVVPNGVSNALGTDQRQI